MDLKVIGAAFLVASLTACGGGGGSDDPTTATPPSDGEVVKELPTGSTTVTTVEEIESILDNNSEIKADQVVTFVLPESTPALVIDEDLSVMGDLTIK